MKKNIAIIFARGGSKGIPRKNLQKINGISLLEHAIRHGRANKDIEQVYVSSDDDEILKVAETCGSKTIHRPYELATDEAPEWDSWKHAVSEIEKCEGEFDALVSLPTTSPLRVDADISSAIKLYHEETCDAVISITESSRNPYFNMVKLDDAGFVEILMSSNKFIYQRQNAPKVYDITTVCYVSGPEYIRKSMSIFEGKTRYVIIPKERALDIDDVYDLELARLNYGMIDAKQ
jgi:N,N'-diacetyl-8-epilegionaminate cytidylyltransferase